MKTYRFTYSYEVIIKAENDDEAKAKWETVNLKNLGQEEKDGRIQSSEWVDKRSEECVTDDYRQLD